jgi:hypothetical protein
VTFPCSMSSTRCSEPVTSPLTAPRKQTRDMHCPGATYGGETFLKRPPSARQSPAFAVERVRTTSELGEQSAGTITTVVNNYQRLRMATDTSRFNSSDKFCSRRISGYRGNRGCWLVVRVGEHQTLTLPPWQMRANPDLYYRRDEPKGKVRSIYARARSHS